MFVDIVSRGGNLLLIVNLDGQGKLPLIQEKRLKDIGKWLKVNAESIYGTRCYDTKSEGSIRYTRSKNNKTIYAIATEWPGNQLNLKSVIPQNGTKIYLLGVKENLKWNYSKNEGLTIEIPSNLQKESNRPCEYAYSFRIENN
jgi:alpha-L-fucosidase